MKVSEFDYHLPEGLIAQHPLKERDRSRLMVVERGGGVIRDDRFYNIGRYLRGGDALVLNDTRVIRARLTGRRSETGGRVELLMLRRVEAERWEALARPWGRLRIGERIALGGDDTSAELAGKLPGGKVVLHFPSCSVEDLLLKWGRMPLPPYIRRGQARMDGGPEMDDRIRYQTVFAKRDGAVAAPTAGLHFTEDLLQRIEGLGVSISFITLHVGWGTFRPVRSEEVERHRMEPEGFHVSHETASLLNQTKRAGGRVIAVGTTVARALETAASDDRVIRGMEGETGLFIYPGFRFRAVDALLTNFHLPRSTLLMLVSAFAGKTLLLKAYEHAIGEGYRFYSYGDAMLIL